MTLNKRLTAIAATLLSISFAVVAAPAVTSTTPVKAQPSAEKIAQRDARMAEHFSKADIDKNGQLSLTEFKAMKQDRDHKGHGKHGKRGGDMMGKMKAKMEKADVNKDGQISKAEAQKDLPRLAQHFDQIDTNKDGQLTHAELKAHHQAMRGAHHAEQEKG